ncbi:MAG TPA: hypothetical protein VIQ31_40415 [Phormidium sp.]
MGNFMQPRYQGAIVDRLLGRANICDRYQPITQRLFEKNGIIPIFCRSRVLCA